MKKLIAILLIAVSMSLFSAEKYAVLIAGDYEATGVPSTALWNTEPYSPNMEFWNDLYLQWEMLYEAGYKKENIKVLFASGLDLWMEENYDYIADRYRATNATGTLLETITNYAATELNVQAVCADLGSKMVYGDDFLYVWVMDHSSSSSIYLMNDALTENVAVPFDRLANYFKPLYALNKVYQLSMNYAENLKIQLQETNAVIIGSSDVIHPKSYRADGRILDQPSLTWTIENEDIDDNRYYHGEVNFHMYSATVGHRPDEVLYYYEDTGGNKYDYFSDADIDTDNQISIKEAYDWMQPRESTADYAVCYDTGTDGNKRGNYISLKYPTLVVNNPESGWYDGVPFSICGNVGILSDVWGGFRVEPFSDVTFLRKPSIPTEFWPWIDFDHECTIIAESPENPLDVISGFSMISSRIENMKLNFLDGSQLDLFGRCTFSGVDLNMNAGSTVNMNQATLNTSGNTTITGNITFLESSDLSVTIGTKLIVKSGSYLKFLTGSKIWLGQGSELVIDVGATLDVNNIPVVVSPGSKLTINGTLIGEYYEASDLGIYPEDKDAEPWLGIFAGVGSVIDLSNVKISGAECAISGTPASLSVTNCTFTDCTNGINIVGCNNYTLEDNTLTGVDEGFGIIITSSDGTFSRNIINHFKIGAYFVMSSPVVSKCEISYNKYFGVVSSGHDAIPQLINTEDNQPFGAVNCTIQKNAFESHESLFPSAQIGINPTGSIYMRYNDIISSPNFYGISIAQEAIRDPNQIITIDAILNYWGTEDVTDDYFFEHPQYIIKYDPTWSLADEYNSSFNSYITEESRILTNAISLETEDKLTPAIKLYEHIIKKYVDTPEYYVAMTRLPYLYEQAELDNNVLISMYDEALNSDATSHKKFFKGKKVATHIKGRRYDDAIAVAEEMKAEADFEEEVVLAEINIALATLLKEAEGKGNRSVDNSAYLQELLTKLYGTEKYETPSDISENALPSESKLHQNYPNPFNPVTQIKYDLAKTSDVKLSVYNISGQKVAELASGVMNAGNHAVEFDGSKLNSGVYYYTLETDGVSMTKKMVLTK